MKLKIALGAILIFVVAFSGVVEASYDLPKIKVEKKHKKTSDTEKEKILKSDWKNFLAFEEEMKNLLAENPNLAPSDSRRVGNDKNLIFVAFYKGRAYFLDKYSIKILKDGETWRQHIFPIGEKLSGKSSRITEQTFHVEDEKFYNSSKRKNNLEDAKDAEDKNFLQECLKVGYYFAFKKEVDSEN